ncbi:hypothetical protein DPMN_082658 [Dreissena polymorpha]|uniref:Uncharacterized protein n=1 Tax=Dreissena polymorpha TaxID=45954 RepID=A0A9D3Y8H7_DREPO|nr:hypothetical protein DPMN_082658 [Dreissena polymorpha]
MSSSRSAWCSTGRPRGAQHKGYRECKAVKAHFRRAMRRCGEQFMTELDHKLEYDSVHDGVSFWRTEEVASTSMGRCIEAVRK